MVDVNNFNVNEAYQNINKIPNESLFLNATKRVSTLFNNIL
jgi:hypothetical protein